MSKISPITFFSHSVVWLHKLYTCSVVDTVLLNLYFLGIFKLFRVNGIMTAFGKNK